MESEQRSEDLILPVDINSLVEIDLNDDEDFLKIRETLTRIGIASRKERTLFQSCHILHNAANIISFISKNFSLWMERYLHSMKRI